MEVNAAVTALREQLAALQGNADPARTSVIKLNLREAEETLARCANAVASAAALSCYTSSRAVHVLCSMDCWCCRWVLVF
jgi:hypothetical protein